MPTSFEVAGLVLSIVGAYPAIIAVLDIYTSALESRSIYYEQKIQALKLDLNVQAVLFENSCIVLLGERDVSSLRSGNPDWNGIEDTLKTRFTDEVQWSAFCSLLKSLYGTWEDLGKHIPKVRAQKAQGFLSLLITILELQVGDEMCGKLSDYAGPFIYRSKGNLNTIT